MEPLDWQKAGFEPHPPGKRKADPSHDSGELPRRPELPGFHDGPMWPMDAGIPVDYADDFGNLTDLPPRARSAVEANVLSAPSRSSDFIGLAAKATARTGTGTIGKPDMVNLPPHYARFKIEPIRFIAENKLDWFQGNIVKYVLRHDAKNGMEDIAKVRRYAHMYDLYLQGNPDWWKAGKPEDFKP